MVLVDSEGEFNTVVFGAGIGAFIGGGIALIQGKSAQEVFSAAVGGMVTGAIVGSGAGLLGTIGTGAAGNVAGQLTERALLGQPSTLQQAGTDAVVGGVGGGLGYGVGKYAIEPITNKALTAWGTKSAGVLDKTTNTLPKEVWNLSPDVVDTNKINHVFANPKHNLQGLVKHFGSAKKAYSELQRATEAKLSANTTGLFRTNVDVAGKTIRVKGSIVDGAVRIGTARIKIK